jgi:hypothetical protein
MYVEMASGVTANDLYQHLKSTYEVSYLTMQAKVWHLNQELSLEPLIT